jgi:photosystem II stability/assembly factor-like uncharacterized protein
MKLSALIALTTLLSFLAFDLATSSYIQQDAVNAMIHHSTNQQSSPKPIEMNFREFEYIDENYGWAATDHSLWQTINGGKSWKEIRTATMKKVSTAAEPYRESQGFIERIQILSRTEGWILEDSALLHTTDGGTSWKKYDPEYIDIRSFRFINRNKGWYIAQHLFYGENKPFRRAGEIYETQDGGLSWQKVPVSMSLEWVWLLDIGIASPNNIWIVGDVILHSQDRGKTWEEVDVERGNGFYGRASRIQFIDSNIGWITADGYLITTDGGKTWTPRSIEEGVEYLMNQKRRGPMMRYR